MNKRVGYNVNSFAADCLAEIPQGFSPVQDTYHVNSVCLIRAGDVGVGVRSRDPEAGKPDEQTRLGRKTRVGQQHAGEKTLKSGG